MVNLEEVQETPGLDPSSTQNQQRVQRVAQRAEAPSWSIKSKEMPEMFGHQNIVVGQRLTYDLQ